VSIPATIPATLPDALDPLSVGKCSRSPTIPRRRHDSIYQVFQLTGRPRVRPRAVTREVTSGRSGRRAT
jgi:hypothetical protein